MDTVVVTETAGQMWTIVVVGIGTVFLCLFALVVMVSVFKAIFVREPKAAPKAEAPAAPAPTAPAVARGLDGAVVAAIVAAVSAASGVPAASLRIASIERSGFNTPAWGHIDRA
ncbi:MAG TPA: OadG family transporter subunit [Spirochaetia bacterium]|nr:OadG family transporter subunit [Spirochaetia bacterium]